MNNTSLATRDSYPKFEQEQRPNVNPYRHAAKLVYDRLIWDLNWRSWVSRRRLKRLQEKYSGWRAIIICNGPSLKKVNFSLLEEANIFTFGLNKINLLFDQISFRPKCIIAVNKHVLEQNQDFYNQTDIPLFIDSTFHRPIKWRGNVIFLNSTQAPRKFARDCSISITLGHTVTYVALQLAFHMGFTKVGLIGCDHDFEAKGPPNATVISGKSDPDHFHPDYFSKGVKWQLPDYRSMEVHFELARETYERYGRKIYNCTEGGKLEVFGRWELSEFLKS